MDESSITAPTEDSNLDQNVSPAPPTTIPVPTSDPAVRFRGLGTNFRAKLIGIDDVPDSRGDQMCQESILKLKAAVQASGRHKQKMIINVSLEGIKIVDVLTGEVQHVHPVHRISFIARDLTDRRAFGYVYGAGEGRHQFFGIKTAKAAELLVLALRDLFQVVYNMKKKEIEEAKEENMVNGNEESNEDQPQVPVPVPRQQQIQNEAVYATPNKQKQEGNLFDLEQQLTTIQEGINNIDAIGPWPQDLPTSPDSAVGDLNSGDLFGIANLSDISSVSSDFSCASNIVIDHGHAGGGNQQFERTASSRSCVSFHGIEQSRALSSRSGIHRTASDHRILAVPNESSNCKPVQQKRAETDEARQTVTKDTVIINRIASVNVNTVSKVEIEDEKGSEAKSEKRNGALSVAENDDPTGSLKESSSVRSLPGSDKGSRRHASSFFSRGKKLKSKKEKGADKKVHRGDKPQHHKTASESKKVEDVVKPHNVPSPISELQRRESVSSINSVRSCIVPTTVYNTESVQKSASRTGLNAVSSKVSESQGEDGKLQRRLTADSFVIRSSISPRTRPRPKNYEPPVKDDTPSPSKTNDDEQKNVEPNNPANRSVQLSEDNTTYLDNKESSPSSSPAWVASFDTEFAHLSESKEFESTSNDVIDPFTGLATNELQQTSTPAFEDVSWSPSDSTEVAGNATPLHQPFGEEFSTDPFSSPFEGVDPFASTQMDDPFAETLETFSDPFANKNADSDRTVLEIVEQKQDVSETPEISSNLPTFPAKSEDIMFTMRELKSNSAEESSMTSGMSSGTQSPEHTGTTKSDIDFAAPVIPPRSAKRSPIVKVSPTSDCPSVPPPPLPESLPESFFDEDFEEEDILDEDNKNSPSPIMELQPPEIPQRAYASLENSHEIEPKPSEKGVIQSNSSNNVPLQKNASYSDELFDLASPVAQPAPQPGARLTKEQILSSFGAQQQGMFPGQPGMMMPPQGAMQYNQNFQQQIQGFPQAAPPMGMFPSGPSPAIPPRPGAMRPVVNQPLPGGAAQNPFGDSISTGAPPMLAPVNTNAIVKEDPVAPAKSDPFAALLPGMGGSGASSKKDMFKNFQMAKPSPSPPVNTSNDPPVSAPPASDFENYFLNSVGGVAIQEHVVTNNPVPTPQSSASDPFGFGSDAHGQTGQPAAADLFGGNQAFSQPFDFNQGTDNTQSLFG